MSIKKVNPENPVLQATFSDNEGWMKLCAMTMFISGIDEVSFTLPEVDVFTAKNLCIVVDEPDGKVRLRLMPMNEAVALAKKGGYLND